MTSTLHPPRSVRGSGGFDPTDSNFCVSTAAYKNKHVFDEITRQIGGLLTDLTSPSPPPVDAPHTELRRVPLSPQWHVVTLHPRTLEECPDPNVVSFFLCPSGNGHHVGVRTHVHTDTWVPGTLTEDVHDDQPSVTPEET